MGRENIPKKIIFNADDFGLTEGINNGIIYAYQRGIVTRASIMASGSAFEHAVSLAKQNPGFPIGIHLTLIAENPVSPSNMIKSLTNREGRLFKNYRIFLMKWLLKQISLEEVRIEIESQIKKMLNAGLAINHIDSHQHLHMLPEIFEVVIGIAEKFKINKIRLAKKEDLRIGSMKELALTVMQKMSRKKLNSREMILTDNLWGINRNGAIKEEDLLIFLQKIKPGITEIICHPGYVDKEYICKYSDWGYLPEQELKALTSERVQRKLRLNNVKLIF